LKKLLVASFLILSISTQADIISKIKNFLGLSKSGPSIVVPELPNIKANSKQMMSEVRKKNNVKYSQVDANNYNYSYVHEIYNLVHKKKASKSFVSKWMNVLAQGGSREGVYRSLVLDRNYLALANYKNTLNEKTADFTQMFMQKFLGRTLAKEKILETNIYNISRAVTEKSLEIIDVLLNRPNDDIYDWYAVFSTDIAKSFPNLWNSKVRASTSLTAQKAWAKSVPDDYIKSEVIIKLNKVLNLLESR